MIPFIIYLSGFSLCFVSIYRHILDTYKKVTLSDLMFCLLISMFSWIGAIISGIEIYKDVIIINKKNKKKQ